jgi:hypothetical protein
MAFNLHIRPCNAQVILLRMSISCFWPFFVVTLGERRNLINSKILRAVLMNRMGEKLPPGHIYVFGSEPYKGSVTQLECYKALLGFLTICPLHRSSPLPLQLALLKIMPDCLFLASDFQA